MNAPRESLGGGRLRYRVIGWMLRHPNRLTYVVAEFFRPLSVGQKIDNAGFHVRHWNDVEAWRARGDTP